MESYQNPAMSSVAAQEEVFVNLSPRAQTGSFLLGNIESTSGFYSSSIRQMNVAEPDSRRSRASVAKICIETSTKSVVLYPISR